MAEQNKFSQLSEGDKIRFLMETSPTFAKLSPEDKNAYLDHLAGKPEPEEKPGVGATLWNDVKGAAKNVYDAFANPSPEQLHPQMSQLDDAAAASAQRDQDRKNSGYGSVYRTIAPIGEQIGVPVSGMEQAAREGNPSAVYGHAAFVPTMMAAAETASRIPIGDMAGKIAPKVVPRTIGEKVGITGYPEFDPRLGKMATAANKEGRASMIPLDAKPPIDPVTQAVAEGRANELPTKVKTPEQLASERGLASKLPVRSLPPEQAVVRNAVQAGTAAKVPLRLPPLKPFSEGAGPEGIAPTIEGVSLVPEPKPLFPGQNDKYAASIPRPELDPLAQTGFPGAATQLQQLGRPIIYIPKEAGYPGPRLKPFEQ